MVLVMAGTDHHPFGRLISWTDDWVRSRPEAPVRMITQHGRTFAPRLAQARDFLPRAELDRLLREASVVICHGGPSTIVETLRRGLVPIVLARTVSLGEHVDDHQQRFARVMAQRGLIRLVQDRESLLQAVDDAVREPLLVAEGARRMADPAESALRLGKLVDELVIEQREIRRQRSWLRRSTAA